MNNVNMANMAAMGQGVATPLMMNNGGVLPQGTPRPMQPNDNNRTQLNTFIYEYFVRHGMYDCARAILACDMPPKVQLLKDGSGGRRDENGNLVAGNTGDDPMDTDSKDDVDPKRPEDIPPPMDNCFLYEWFCIFWDMANAQKGKGSNSQINQYVQHSQHTSRMRQEHQQNILRNMNPNFTPQQQYQQQMMRNMQNGAMGVGMKQQANLQRAAIANSNPQALQMLQNKPGQMQRDPSDMDGSRARPASPGSADNAPSPSKRQRLDGGAFNPNQGGMVMQNGRPAQGMPGQQQVGNGPNSSAQQLLLQSGINPASLNPDQLQVFANQNPAVQAKTIATYAANLQQHHGSQMPNKPMPNSAPIPQGQGSPMVPQGPDGANLGAFYNAGEMAPGNMRPGPNNGQAAGGNNHALQDYQMQLMLLEQQNKKRLMMARQEQDMSTMPRDGPGGPGGPAGAPQGPNGGQAFQGTSPPGGRPGASPNPADQMKRVNQQMANPANMGSPLPADGGAAAARNSPSNAMSFMGNLDAPAQAQFMNMVNTGQINGGMRPPGPHPGQPFNGQMNPQQQQQMMGRGQQAPGGPNLQWQAGPNPQIPPGGAQPGVQGTPQPRSMPPPSAPAAAAAANNANSRNTTSSPQVPTAAPPTPQQSNKAAPKKKDGKAKAKAATQKKSNSNLNSGATPAADAAPEQEPTPATPITPVNPASFGKGQNAGAVVVNGQATAPAASAAAAVVPPHADSAPNGFTMDSSTGLDFGGMDFANPLTSSDVLNDFDFDSFLHDGAGADDGSFDFANSAFGMEGGEIGAE